MYYDKTVENQIAIDETPEHTIPGGQINETSGNLFDYENEYALAHWISADCRFDVGLAKIFDARYSLRGALRPPLPHVEGCCIATHEGHIFNLIIKEHQYEIPTITAIENALHHMKSIAEERGIYKIALPRIYADSAGVSWLEVKDKLINIFAGTDFDIRVVYLNEYLDGSIIDPDMERLNYGKDRQAIDGNTRYKYY